ncbi:MAG: alanine racemase [Syntrophomonadaceae bacterium]
MDNRRPTWAEINLTAISHNVAQLQEAVKPARVMAVVKANGYGHGVVEVSRVCQEQGVDFLGVASLDEAMTIREAGMEPPILVLGYIPQEFARTVVSEGVRATIFESGLAQALSRAAVETGLTAHVHIKIDTGMGRLGYQADPETVQEIIRLSRLPGLHLEGIFTHFALADVPDKSYTFEQLRVFEELLDSLTREGVVFDIRHCANSAALMEIPQTRFNMVRAGIAIYGLYPDPEHRPPGFNLIPAMQLKSRVSFVKTLHCGQSVSYGRTYRCTGDTRVATVPIGYADGYSRLLSNRAWAYINGQRAPLIGTVCMDQVIFDVSAIPGVKEGDEVFLFGRPENGVTADDLAGIIGTINYEIVCAVSSRVPRIYVKGLR